MKRVVLKEYSRNKFNPNVSSEKSVLKPVFHNKVAWKGAIYSWKTFVDTGLPLLWFMVSYNVPKYSFVKMASGIRMDKGTL